LFRTVVSTRREVDLPHPPPASTRTSAGVAIKLLASLLALVVVNALSHLGSSMRLDGKNSMQRDVDQSPLPPAMQTSQTQSEEESGMLSPSPMPTLLRGVLVRGSRVLVRLLRMLMCRLRMLLGFLMLTTLVMVNRFEAVVRCCLMVGNRVQMMLL